MPKTSKRSWTECLVWLLLGLTILVVVIVAVATRCRPTHSDADEPTPAAPGEHPPAAVTVKGYVYLSGTSDGLGGVTVDLLAPSTSGAWATVARCRTDPDGRFSLASELARRGEYRLREQDPEGYESTAATAPAGGSVLDANTVLVVLPLMETDRVIFYDRRVEVTFAGYVYEHGTACGIGGVTMQLLSDEAGDRQWKLLTTAETCPDGSFILSACWDEDTNYRVVECDQPGYLSTGAVAPQPGRVIGVNAVEYCGPPACAYTGICFYDDPPPDPPTDEHAVCFSGRVLERGTDASLAGVPVLLLRRRIGASGWTLVASEASRADGSFELCDQWSDGYAYQLASDPLPGYRTVRVRVPFPGKVSGDTIRFPSNAPTLYGDIVFWQRR